MRTTRIFALLCVLQATLPDRAAFAQPHAGVDSEATAEARRAYLEGVELVKQAHWADALAAFERSSQLRPHATTTFSIGACERALGRSTRARVTLSRALAEGRTSGSQLPAALASDAQAYIGEIDELLVHVNVHVNPPHTEITVDGRPLQALPEAYPLTLVSGLLPPGRGSAPPAPDFELIVEPGTHVIMLGRTGYTTAVVTRTWEPGSRPSLLLELARLPATIHVASAQPGAIVTVDDIDVGPAPVEVSRAPGSYRILARKPGFATYQTRVTVEAGQRVDLLAPLPVEKRPIYKQWWFWTGAVVVVGAVVGIAVGVTQAQPPPFQGGSTGWVAQAQ